MKLLLTNKYYLLISRYILGIVFIYAGAEKISNPDAFAQAIINYKLFPIWIINITAITLPWIELVTGILLIFRVYIKINSGIILSLLLVFEIIIIISLLRGLNIDCGCFGGGTKIGITKLLENFLLILISISLILFDKNIYVQE